MSAFSGISVDRPVATIMIVIAVVVFGRVSLDQIPVDLLPEIGFPTVTVRTEYEGAAPEEVEREVVDVLEDVLRTVEGVTEVESVSRAGSGDIYLRFPWDSDLDDVTQRIRERLSLIRLDDAIEQPRILRYDPTLEPIMRVALTGRSLAQLRRYAADEVKPTLESLPGVALVRINGGAEEIVRVAVEPDRLAAFGISVDRLEERLRSENLSLAGGQLEDRGREVIVRTSNEFRSVEELGMLVIAERGGASLRLQDVAEVSIALDESDSWTTRNAEPAVELEIFREADANLVSVADQVQTRIFEGDNALADSAPTGASFAITDDQSVYINAAIDEVISTALLGALCAIAVLLIALRRVWPTVVIALAIPLSILATFAPLRWFGVSLNIMSLGGLALGVGMLVDNAIVVLEAVVRRREEGEGPRDASLRGSSEVAGAVIASTLTTVAVFGPIVFVEGVAGQLFGDLALTVVLSLLASLVFALFFVPMLLALPSRLRAGETEGKAVREALWPPLSWTAFVRDMRKLRVSLSEGPGWRRALFVLSSPLVATWLALRLAVLLPLELLFVFVVGGALRLGGRAGASVERWLARRRAREAARARRSLLEDGYAATLRGVLRAPVAVLALAVALIAGSFALFPRLGVELIPDLEQREFSLRLQWPQGMPLADVAEATRSLEGRLVGQPRIVGTATVVGQQDDTLELSNSESHIARLRVQLDEEGELSEARDEALQAIRQELGQVPGLMWTVEESQLVQTAPPIRVELVGYELQDLRRGAEIVSGLLEETPGLTDVRNRQQRGNEELIVQLDRERLASLGLTALEVAEQIRALTRGERITSLSLREGRLDIELRGGVREAFDAAALEELAIPLPQQALSGANIEDPSRQLVAGVELEELLTSSAGSTASEGRAVRLSSIARFQRVIGPSEIRHVRGRRTAVVEAGTDGTVDVGTLADEVEAALTSLSLPTGVRASLSGQRDDIDAARNNLLFALGLALFLVYAVMASRFESLIAPLLIMVSVPLALAGVLIGMVIWQRPLSVIVFIGLIVLVGIVVNNAIVLIDYILQRERDGEPRELAIVSASTLRLRPVLITAATTVLGLVPMLLTGGEGAEIRQPLAFVVVFGLSFSTLLTLLVVPVLYRVFMPEIQQAESNA